MLRMIHAKPHLVVALITLLSLPLFLFGLNDTYLWQDEAQTALLGRSVLQHGVPMVGAGADSLSAVRGRDAGIGGVYFQVAWLQAYLTAASFTIFGETSWSARLPFALAGWLCVPLLAWTLRRAGASARAASLASLLLAVSVPFIICSRQARYYSLSAACVLLTAGCYAGLVQRRREDASSPIATAAGLAAAATLLVLSFDVTAIGILLMLAGHWILTSRAPARWSVRFWGAWGFALLVLAMWIAFSFSASSRHDNAGLTTLPARIRHGGFYYLGQINAHIVPLPVLLLAGGLWLRHRPPASDRHEMSANRAAVLLLAAIAVGGIVGGMLLPHRFFRYIVPVFPILIGIAAVGLAWLWSLSRLTKVVAIAVVLTLVASNVLFVWSHSLLAAIARGSGVVTVRERPMAYQIPLALLIREFRDPPRGPIAAMIGYLREHARASDVLVTTYGDLPLKFHTDIDVYGGETGQLPPDRVRPDWIWPRTLKVYPEVQPVAEWIDRELSKGTYNRVELPVADRRWENREDPEEHIFSNPGPDGPRVALYRLRRGVE